MYPEFQLNEQNFPLNGIHALHIKFYAVAIIKRIFLLVRLNDRRNG